MSKSEKKVKKTSSKKKERSEEKPSPQKEDSKWQDFLRRHSKAEKKDSKGGSHE